MRVLRKQACLPPVALLVHRLSGPCTSMAFAQQSPEDPMFLVLGRTTGEIIFLPFSKSLQPSNFESEEKLPITAIAEGYLRDQKVKEIVTIQSNGLIQALDYPSEVDGPVKVFSQQIYANVNDCRVMDIDGDKFSELLVMLTDRVGRCILCRSFMKHDFSEIVQISRGFGQTCAFE